MYILKSHQIQHNPFDRWLQWEAAADCIGKGFKISFSHVPKWARSNKKVTYVTVRKSLGLGLGCYNSWVTWLCAKKIMCQQMQCLLKSITIRRRRFSASVVSVFFDSSSALSDCTEPHCLEACGFVWRFFCCLGAQPAVSVFSLFSGIFIVFAQPYLVQSHANTCPEIALRCNLKSSPISASCAFCCVPSYAAPYFGCDSHLIMLKP